MKDVAGVVSQIQEFSVHDGDGIRTTVFMAGCPLRCQWCANPETWEKKGTVMTVEEVVQRVLRSAVFFRASGGGVTFSGGEPALQPGFLRALIDAFDDLGVDMAIETSGSFRWEELEHHIRKLSLVFVDIKHMDNVVHRSVTGKGNGDILENIKRIGRLRVRTIIRIPLIKGINDDEENLVETARFIREAVPEAQIEILPYHNFGSGKYSSLGLVPPMFEVPAAKDVERAQSIIEKAGMRTIEFR